MLNSLVFGELRYTALVNRAGALVLRCRINRRGLDLACNRGGLDLARIRIAEWGTSLAEFEFGLPNRTSTGSSRKAWITQRDISHPERHESSRERDESSRDALLAEHWEVSHGGTIGGKIRRDTVLPEHLITV